VFDVAVSSRAWTETTAHVRTLSCVVQCHWTAGTVILNLHAIIIFSWDSERSLNAGKKRDIMQQTDGRSVGIPL
jgi:hypothetical protein